MTDVEASAGRGRRWRVVAVVVGGAVVAAAGLAAGAGVTPGEFVDRLRGTGGGENEPDLGRAELMTSDDLDGAGVQLWIAPARGGDEECTFVRSVWTTGASDSDPRCADPLLPWSDDEFEIGRNAQYFGWIDTMPVGSIQDGFRAVGLTGAVHPDVTAITAHLGDGSQYTFSPLPPDGWFAVVLPDQVADLDRVDGHLVNGLVRLELFDDEGARLTTVDPTTVEP